ncbi:MAG TPA: hypothetical protein VKY74_07120 [Chloroflexia bacterium]|nr:hypothetical protein [Chloroflexia bacterium]
MNLERYTCPHCSTPQYLVGGQRFCQACQAPLPPAALATVPPVQTGPPATGIRPAARLPAGLRLIALRLILSALGLVWFTGTILNQLPPYQEENAIDTGTQYPFGIVDARQPPMPTYYIQTIRRPGVLWAWGLAGLAILLVLALYGVAARSLWQEESLGWWLALLLTGLDLLTAAILLLVGAEPASAPQVAGSLVVDVAIYAYLLRPAVRARFS